MSPEEKYGYVKKNSTYIFDSDEDKFAIPFMSEDGNQFLIVVKCNGKGTYIPRFRNELSEIEGGSLFDAAAISAMSCFEAHLND